MAKGAASMQQMERQGLAAADMAQRGGDAMLQPDAPAAGMDGGSDVAVGVKVKARAHVAAQMGRENPPKKLEQLPKSGVDNYACTAEC